MDVTDSPELPLSVVMNLASGHLDARSRRDAILGGALGAAGGDGTIDAVAQQVPGSGRPLGPLPQGIWPATR